MSAGGLILTEHAIKGKSSSSHPGETSDSTSDVQPRSAPALELLSRAVSSVGVMYRSSGPDTGSNPGEGRILKKLLVISEFFLRLSQRIFSTRNAFVDSRRAPERSAATFGGNGRPLQPHSKSDRSGRRFQAHDGYVS